MSRLPRAYFRFRGRPPHEMEWSAFLRAAGSEPSKECRRGKRVRLAKTDLSGFGKLTGEKMAKIEKIETYVIPHYLYRYRSLNEFDREMGCIEQACVYCADFTMMNDPMEGHYSESKLLEKTADIKQVRAKILSGKMMIGMCAFSEVFNHELMWAHYADQFRGICIAYDFFMLRRHLPDGATFSRLYYNEDVPKVGFSKQPRDHNEIAKMIISYKNHRWLYEREWRMFASKGKVEYNNQRCVARVYLGSRINENRRRDIEKTP